MRKTVLTWNMLLSYIAGIIMLMEPIKQYLWSVITGVKTYVTNPVNLVFTCFALGGYLLFTPLITALPGAAVFVDDYNSGYIKSILTRMSRKKYVLYRLTSCMISGGVAVCLPVITLFLISLVTSNLGNSRENIINLFTGSILGNASCLSELFLMITGCAFLFGAAWGGVGLAVAACIPNKYTAYCGGLAVFYAIHIITNLLGVAIYSPVNMLFADVIPNWSMLLIYQGSIIAIAVITFLIAMKRRFENI